ncbi:MAG: AhpC/TSA family protein [Bacteroidaceae bacterium]|nr:AhpC/TSA family protein [Bacteroidaceae bacterium]
MKKLLILAIPAMLMSCGPEKYTINGKAGEEENGKQVLLLNNENEAIDSCLVADGAFSFTGNVDDQTICTIGMEGTKANVLLQNGTKITVDMNTEPPTVSDNGGLNDIYKDIADKVNKASDELNEKAAKMMAEGKNYQEIHEALDNELEAMYDIFRDGIRKNKDNIVGAHILSMVARQFYPTVAELDSVMSEVKYATSIKVVTELRKSLLAAENTKEGNMFTDFTGLDIEGNASSLSDHVGKGKYVLVDFWASWCGPCKAEIPNLIELYKQFNGENFTVLGVNVWDEESKFRSALESEGIEYPQIFIPRDNKDNATQLYGIHGIPQIILFGPDGTIVKRNLRGEEMKNFVSEQLK